MTPSEHRSFNKIFEFPLCAWWGYQFAFAVLLAITAGFVIALSWTDLLLGLVIGGGTAADALLMCVPTIQSRRYMLKERARETVKARDAREL